jgi:hypothetical protein
MAEPDLNIKAVIEALDGFYCHNVIVSLWADAVANRLEGLAIYLLSDELPEVAEHARKAAARLADRIGDLGGAITADPRTTTGCGCRRWRSNKEHANPSTPPGAQRHDHRRAGPGQVPPGRRTAARVPRHLLGSDPACASAGWNPRARTRSRTLTSSATSKRDIYRLRRMGRTRTAAVGVARSGVCGSVWPGSAW